MTPDPTPDWGRPENGSDGSAAAPLTAIVTMAGETFSAARVIAELSSIEIGTGCVACWAWPTGATVATSRSRVPVAERMPYVPSEPIMAAPREAATTTPTMPPRRAVAVRGAGVPTGVPAPAAGSGSNQARGVGGATFSASVSVAPTVHAGRRSAAGE